MEKRIISEVCTINPPKIVPLSSGEAISFIPMDAVSTDGTVDLVRTISVGQIKNYSCFQNGDVLFAKITPCMENGKGAVVSNLQNGYGAGSTEFIVLRPNVDLLSAKWLFYYFLQKPLRMWLRNHMTGSAGQKRVPPKFLAQQTIPLPPLSEQQRIVARIEELFSQLDSGVETLRKTKQQLAVYRQAVLKEAFEGRLTGSLPIGEELIGKFIESPRYGTAKKCSYSESAECIDVYRIPNIDYSLGRIDHTDIKRASFSDSELVGIQLQPDDILIIRSNGSASLVGRAALVRDTDTNATFAGYLMRLRIKDKALLFPKYLLLYLQSHSARIYIENKAKSTSGVHNINTKEIAALQIPIFDYEDQKIIVEAIESRLSVCDSIENTVDVALQQAEALRQSILKDAFEGRI